jgi:alkanesulfonate monooxygenase SsuD/methylene tetrahydromethanopterin reductase-like flavin-dependent oxidoreductase (luciferase family)
MVADQARPKVAAVIGPGDPHTWSDRLAWLESLGVDAVYASDHLDDGPEPLTLLAWLAARTTLAVGSYVLCTPLHEPRALARQAAALAAMAVGPVHLGLGAGWRDRDLRTAGVPVDSGARVDAFQRYLSQLLEALAGESCRPNRLVIGASRPRMLRLAARTADVVAIVPTLGDSRALDAAGDVDRLSFDQKLRVVREAAGDRSVARSVLVPVLRIGDADVMYDALARAAAVEPSVLRNSPHVHVGSAEQLALALADLATDGISEVVVPERALVRLGKAAATVVGR